MFSLKGMLNYFSLAIALIIPFEGVVLAQDLNAASEMKSLEERREVVSTDYMHQKMEAFKEIDSITMILELPDVESVIGYNEDMLLQRGCRYQSREKKKIEKILKIIKNANIKADPFIKGTNEKRTGIDAREEVILGKKNGSSIKLFFEDALVDQKTVDGMMDEIPIVANVSLVQEFYKWASDNKPIESELTGEISFSVKSQLSGENKFHSDPHSISECSGFFGRYKK